jgi:hypothetical protein
VDGYHRYFAYLKTGVDEVDTVVHKGTRRDAEVFSWGVNDKHGQPRSNATKRLIVMKALDDIEYQDRSDRELALVLKLSNTFIGSIRKEINNPKPVVATNSVATPKPVESKSAPVEVFKPVEQMEDDDQLTELASLNQELAEENEKYKTQSMILEGDSAKIEETITDLRKKIEFLEMENRSIKNSRDQFQSKCAELVKTVNYLKKKLEKFGKVD